MKAMLTGISQNLRLATITLIATAGISVTAWGCEKPTPPALPDPDTAITPQMIKAKNDMKAYIDAAEIYLKCVEDNTGKYNDMVDAMQSAADGFNSIVRKYKKRMSGG